MSKFCNENILSKEIRETILPEFLNINEINLTEIEKIYNHFKNAFDLNKEERFKIENNFLLKSNEIIKKDKYKIGKEATHLGIDFPIWFDLKNNEPSNIMLLGLDPLRSHCFPDDKVWLGTPYALHCSEFRESYRYTKKYFDFIQQLSIENGVYITDASKVFYRLKDNRSTNSVDFWQQPIHFEILKKEIEIVNPKLIITLGSVAAHIMSGTRIKSTDKINFQLATYNKNIDENLNLGSTPLLCLPHLSNANNSNINKFLNINIADFKNKTQVESYLELVKERLK